MGDHLQYIHPCDTLFFHQVDRIGVLLHENGGKHIPHFRFGTASRVNVCHHIVDGT